MKRRTALVALGLYALPLRLRAQQRVFRIGFLSVVPLSDMKLQLDALRAGLRDLGYVEGKNISFEYRSAEGNYARLPALVADLVQRKVDLIVTVGTAQTQAAKKATATIPIVMVGAADPVASGLVASLARPGGNVTGTSNISPPLMVKRLELLREVRPSIKRVGVLVNPSNPAQRLSAEAVEAAGKPLKIDVHRFEVKTHDEIAAAFAAMAKQHVEAVAVANDSILIANARVIAQLAAKERILSAGNVEYAEAGGLVGFGSIANVYRHSAFYVDRILKGAKPADLPVEQPSKLDVVLNLRTAKALGLSIPQPLLQRVDRVIE